MRRIFLGVFLVIGCFLTGCIVVEDRPLGDVDISWTLAGYDCVYDPYVANIRIRIGDEFDADYPCSYGGQSVLVEDFYPGTYQYTVDAEDEAGCILFRATGYIDIDGEYHLLDLDLPLFNDPNC